MTKYKQYMLTSLMAVTVATGIQLGTISTVQAEDARSMPTLSERMKKIAMEQRETDLELRKAQEEALKQQENVLKQQEK